MKKLSTIFILLSTTISFCFAAKNSSDVAFVTSSCLIHDKNCLEGIKNEVRSINYGMLFLNKENTDTDKKPKCTFDNLDDNVGGPGNENPITRILWEHGGITVAKMLLDYTNEGDNSVGITFGGDTGKDTRIIDPLDPGICTSEEFSNLIIESVKHLKDEGVNVNRIALDIESSKFRKGDYDKTHYDNIAKALEQVKSYDSSIDISIILPQYVSGGYWAEGFNQPLKDFIDDNQQNIDDVTFMLGQDITTSKTDYKEPTKQMKNIKQVFTNLNESKMTALFNYKRTLEEGFIVNGKAANQDRLIEVTNELNKNGYAGVQFWGMTNAITGKIDQGFLDLYNTVNKETQYKH